MKSKVISSRLITFEMLESWGRKSKFKEQIPGGKASGRKPEDFDQEQLAKGKEVEMEHTNDPNLAIEIAMDHLSEDKDYYKKLETIDPHEKGAKIMKTVQYKGATYKLAGEDQKAEEAKSDIGKVRERIKGALGLVHDKKWDEAAKLLEELLGDLQEAKNDVKEEAKK